MKRKGTVNTESFLSPVRALPLLVSFFGLVAFAGCASEEEPYDIKAPRNEQLAEDEFADGVDRDPAPTTVHALAQILIKQGKDKQAEFVLMRLIKEHPKFIPAYNELAELYLRTERLGDAVETLELGLKMAPEDPVLLNNLGMCHLLRENYEEALESFTAAAAVFPTDARYRSNMATALGMQGNYDECLALYEQVVPPDEAHYNLAVVCEARGDEERAKLEFERAERLRRDLSYEASDWSE